MKWVKRTIDKEKEAIDAQQQAIQKQQEEDQRKQLLMQEQLRNKWGYSTGAAAMGLQQQWG
eukprot:CAMPEP_0179280886 /NCGR_PEP_ID=MMETSP0797-20121207/36860_1 /TAXON_ID=47934 /ORGANISM="Dinophysis acuminata, Strain DAEP01" /LENGTH=60 /DNA_ID=CAMNT_0020989559 /DNA_START=93 /DNA_END=271 /DNA_ORIENTATION=-